MGYGICSGCYVVLFFIHLRSQAWRTMYTGNSLRHVVILLTFGSCISMFFSTEYNRSPVSVPSLELGPSTPSAASECRSPSLGSSGRHTRVRGRGVPNSDEGKDTLVLYVYFNPSTGFFLIFLATVSTYNKL